MRMTVKLKLGLAFAAIVALTVITAWLGLANFAALSVTVENVLQGPVERVQLADQGLGRAGTLAAAVATGDLTRMPLRPARDEFGDLTHALDRMTANLYQTAMVAKAIAGGDLMVRVSTVRPPRLARDRPRGNGVALSMTSGGADQHDMEFERM